MLRIPITRHRLDNGLRVVLSEDHTAPVVAVNLWYGVGSRNEREGKTGFAHLFEHMMFQGSVNVPKNRHFELIERAGGTMNATTWFDRTNYFETLPSQHLETALWLEADRMGWMLPAMTQEKLDNQRDVVKNERRWRYDNQPYGDWDERIQSMVYPNTHPYHHTVIGSMEDIDAATLDDVAEFFRTFYVPNNAVLTLCGDFDLDRVMDLVERYFGEIPEGEPIPAVPGETDIDARIGQTVEELVEAAVPLPRQYLAFRIPSYPSPEFPAARIMSSVLGGGRASRLYRSLVREKQVAKDVVSYAFPLLDGAMFLLWITGYPGATPEALGSAMGLELEDLAHISDEDVARAVALEETRFVRSMEHVGDRADVLSMYELYFDDPDRVHSDMDRLRSVSAETLRSFAAGYLVPDNQAVLTYVPEATS